MVRSFLQLLLSIDSEKVLFRESKKTCSMNWSVRVFSAFLDQKRPKEDQKNTAYEK